MSQPSQVWVTDMAYIPAKQGCSQAVVQPDVEYNLHRAELAFSFYFCSGILQCSLEGHVFLSLICG